MYFLGEVVGEVYMWRERRMKFEEKKKFAAPKEKNAYVWRAKMDESQRAYLAAQPPCGRMFQTTTSNPNDLSDINKTNVR